MVTLRSNKGFSLIEVMISLAIFSLIIGLIINSKTTQTDSYMSQNQVVEMQQALRVSMIMMTQEIRKIGFDPYLDPAGVRPGITNYGAGTNASRLTFTYVADDDAADNDGDGFINELKEQQTVSIYVDNNNQLILSVANAQTIAQNVQSLVITYHDSNGVIVAAPPAGNLVVSVRIALTMSPDARYIYESGNTQTVRTLIQCRNIRST